jgi:hypothetical protein
MAFTQLIDTQYVFIHSTIDKNTDADLIDPNIIVAQDTNIQQIIGYTLYQKLMDMVSDGSINDSGNINYKILLANHVQPALCHWTVWHSLPSIQYRLTNKSILSKNAENSTTTGLSELKYLRENVKHYADFYNQRIRELIINNPSAYPEYFQSVGVDRIRPKRTTYFSGWSGNEFFNGKKPNNGHNDPDCCSDPSGYPLNW